MEGQAYLLADMIAARQERRQTATSVFDNLNSLAMVFAAQEAVHRDIEVKVEAPEV